MGYWDAVAASFSNNKYVIGYDPINEPMPSNIYTEPSLFLEHGKFDREILQPLYKRSYDVYQKYDQSKAMFFEAAEFPDEIGIFGGFVFNLGFTQAPGGKENLSN